eukprot:4603377-Prorocentrum_lima.AAC.1
MCIRDRAYTLVAPLNSAHHAMPGRERRGSITLHQRHGCRWCCHNTWVRKCSSANQSLSSSACAISGDCLPHIPSVPCVHLPPVPSTTHVSK